MDIKWKDEGGNILNANKDRIIYLDIQENIKTTLKKDEIKKITIENGMMNIFRNFGHDLILTILIPRKSQKDAVKIFNVYDKTGDMLKGKSNHFLLNLILESSLILGSQFLGIFILLSLIAAAMVLIVSVIGFIFGEIGIKIARIVIIGYPIYLLIDNILTRVKRANIKEI